MTLALEPLQPRWVEIERIAWAAHQGAMGLFVGTGFSKHATANLAPSFIELLNRVASRLGLLDVFAASSTIQYQSLPQIASTLLSAYVKRSTRPDVAPMQFREVVAQACNLVPAAHVANDLAAVLRATTPAWIVTTNYDLLLEHLLDDAVSVVPPQPFVANTSKVPVFHLHGSRRSPSTIKMTEEDYVGLLAPFDYSRLKLPLLMAESTTIMIGYAAGDINVRAAMAWAKSFVADPDARPDPWQGRVVQALYSMAPRSEPYWGPNGEIVIETGDLTAFLREIADRRAYVDQWSQGARASIATFLGAQHNALAIITDTARRQEFLGIVRQYLPLCDSDMLVRFIDTALGPVWEQATRVNQFSYYVDYLQILVDIAEPLDLKATRPKLVAYLGDAFDKVGAYVDVNKPPGSAHLATDVWVRDHVRIKSDIKAELLKYGLAHERKGLLKMLSAVGIALPQ